MKITYKKEYIREKCLNKIAILEDRYSKIDFEEADRLEKEENELVSRHSENSSKAYEKHQEEYNKAYSKVMATDYAERQAHYDARQNGQDVGSFYSSVIYPTWTPHYSRGVDVMFDIDNMLPNNSKNSMRNNADAIVSKIKKLEVFVSICEDDSLIEISLDDDEVSLIF